MDAPQSSFPRNTDAPDQSRRRLGWVYDLLLVVILLAGLVLRFTGVNWDAFTHLHPDERFLTMVEAALTPAHNVAEYFNTTVSPLNPANRGYTFFVYGTLPIFIVRYVGEWLGQTGYDQIHLVGRQLSAIFDLLTVFLIYLIGSRVYRKPVGLLAAAFTAFSVLPIQLAHYLTVDTFTNFFGYLAVYFAVLIFPSGRAVQKPIRAWDYLRESLPYVLFGIALGMATASKINAAVLAVLLPLAAGLRYVQMPQKERLAGVTRLGVYLVIAGLASLLVFRICQPYAFNGPSFWNVSLNKAWLDNMKSLSSQSSGSIDFPPALQWARRPLTFAWTNMVLWGMGLPLGLLATAGFIWVGWRILRGEWRRHGPLWLWAGVYFLWQSLNWTRSMRYQMLVYPLLAMMAGWLLVELWKKGARAAAVFPFKKWNLWRVLAVGLGSASLVGTAVWAFAFVQIYARPLTRVAASEWIFQNVPAGINLNLESGGKPVNQPLETYWGADIRVDQPLVMAFQAQESAVLAELQIPQIMLKGGGVPETHLRVSVWEGGLTVGQGKPLAEAVLAGDFAPNDRGQGNSYQVPFGTLPALEKGKMYTLRLDLQEEQRTLLLTGALRFGYQAERAVQTPLGLVYQVLPPALLTIRSQEALHLVFTAAADGDLTALSFPHLADRSGSSAEKTLQISVAPASGLAGADGVQASVGRLQGSFAPGTNGLGQAYRVELDQKIALHSGISYLLSVEVADGEGDMAAYPSSPAAETSWDDRLPQSMGMYTAYSTQSSLYTSDLNFEMYWDDNPDKLLRFLTLLDQSDYIFISSNRQYATTVRVPERYPLTSTLYRELMGCPSGQDVISCYYVAQPGSFSGNLGYELVAVFQSEPQVGPFMVNTQFAEEAFTVYDHPKVLIFKKKPGYSPTQVRALLDQVDLTRVIHLLPNQAR